jgi:hypothetical protein
MRPSNRNGDRKAAVPISAVKHTPTCSGRGCARDPQRKAVKPVREVGYANTLK